VEDNGLLELLILEPVLYVNATLKEETNQLLVQENFLKNGFHLGLTKSTLLILLLNVISAKVNIES